MAIALKNPWFRYDPHLPPHQPCAIRVEVDKRYMPNKVTVRGTHYEETFSPMGGFHRDIEFHEVRDGSRLATKFSPHILDKILLLRHMLFCCTRRKVISGYNERGELIIVNREIVTIKKVPELEGLSFLFDLFTRKFYVRTNAPPWEGYKNPKSPHKIVRRIFVIDFYGAVRAKLMLKPARLHPRSRYEWRVGCFEDEIKTLAGIHQRRGPMLINGVDVLRYIGGGNAQIIPRGIDVIGSGALQRKFIKTMMVVDQCPLDFFYFIEMIKDERILPDEAIPIIMRVLLQVAYVLAYLHGDNKVHGDLKPENILLDKKRNAKVIDFAFVGPDRKTFGSFGYFDPDAQRHYKDTGEYIKGPPEDIHQFGMILRTICIAFAKTNNIEYKELYEQLRELSKELTKKDIKLTFKENRESRMNITAVIQSLYQIILELRIDVGDMPYMRFPDSGDAV